MASSTPSIANHFSKIALVSADSELNSAKCSRDKRVDNSYLGLSGVQCLLLVKIEFYLAIYQYNHMSASCSLVVTFDDVACPTSRVNSTVTIAIASTCFFPNMCRRYLSRSASPLSFSGSCCNSTRKTCMLAACDLQVSFDLVFELLESERLVVLQLHAAKLYFSIDFCRMH